MQMPFHSDWSFFKEEIECTYHVPKQDTLYIMWEEDISVTKKLYTFLFPIKTLQYIALRQHFCCKMYKKNIALIWRTISALAKVQDEVDNFYYNINN